MIDSKSLRQLYRQLKRRHPELIGLGIGWRTKAGRLRKEPAIRLIVAKKRSARSKGVREFPKTIELKAGKGKRSLSIQLFTDVEEAKTWAPTSFPLAINGVPTATASCFVAWKSPDEVTHSGVVTVGHALPQQGQQVNIITNTVVIPGVAFMRSDIIKTGLDVGLVKLTPNPGPYPPCLPAPMNPGAAGINTTINILGVSATDSQIAAMESWHSNTPASGRALAYYETMTIATPNGQSYRLNNVVMAEGPYNTYSPGRSGAPWIVTSNEWNPMAVALQSHGRPDLSYSEGLGTHLLTGLRWLNMQLKAQNCSEFSWGWRL